MPIQKLPFNAKPYQRSDYPNQYSRDNEWKDELINWFIDTDSSVRKRFGYSLFKDVGVTTPIDGFYFWKLKGLLYVVSGGRTFKITDKTGTMTEVTQDSLLSGYRPSFAETGTYLFMCNGQNLLNTDGVTQVAKIDDGDAPGGTSLGFLDTYVLSNVPGSSTFRFSNPGAPLEWPALNFASPEGRADSLQAIFVKDRQVFLFGDKTTEVWFNDGSSPFSRRNDIFIESGCFAKYSIADCDGTFIWMDDNAQVVALTGSKPEVII